MSRERYRQEELPEGHVYKLFVGGVPRRMKKADLIDVFTGLGVQVKQAWLQTAHRLTEGQYLPDRFHRGFGFVVLHDQDSMDQILGFKHSRFLDLPGEGRLELKRALAPMAPRLQSSSVPDSSRVYQEPMLQQAQTNAPVAIVWLPVVWLPIGPTMPAAVAAATPSLPSPSNPSDAAGNGLAEFFPCHSHESVQSHCMQSLGTEDD